MRPSRRACLALLLGASCLAAAGCSRSTAKREAKARVFAPPAPDPVEALVTEPIAVDRLEADRAARDRVFQMSFAEVVRRVGDLRFEGEQSVFLTRGEASLRSLRRARIAQAAAGAFALDLSTAYNQEQHLVFRDGVLYLKHNQGHWRASRDPTDERNRWRDQAFLYWASCSALLGDALQLGKGVQTKWNGRPAWRYPLRVAPQASETPAPPASQPATADPKERDRWLARRAEEWRTFARARSGLGALTVDARAGVVLEASLQSTLVIADSATQPATLELSLKTTLTPLAQPPTIDKPSDYIEEFVRRKIVTNPLSFLGEEAQAETPSRAP